MSSFFGFYEIEWGHWRVRLREIVVVVDPCESRNLHEYLDTRKHLTINLLMKQKGARSVIKSMREVAPRKVFNSLINHIDYLSL